MPRSTRSNKCPDLEEWVFVRFLDDGKYYTCSKQRVLNEVQKPNIHYVLWTDGRKYKARILKHGTKQQVQELTKDTGHHMKSISENDYTGESKVPEIKEDTGHHMKTSGRIPENEDQTKLQVPEVKEDTGHQKLTEDTGYHMNDTTSTPENEEPGESHSNNTELRDAEANDYETFDDSDEDVDFTPGTSDSELSLDEVNQQSLFKNKRKKNVFLALAAAASQEKKPKQLVKREPWLPHEKKAVYSHLASFLRERRVPGKKDCEKCKLAAEGALDRRDWKNIKFFIKNENSKNSAKH